MSRVHTSMHTCTHGHSRTHMHTYMHTCTHAFTHAYTHTCARQAWHTDLTAALEACTIAARAAQIRNHDSHGSQGAGGRGSSESERLTVYGRRRPTKKPSAEEQRVALVEEIEQRRAGRGEQLCMLVGLYESVLADMQTGWEAEQAKAKDAAQAESERSRRTER